MALNSSKKDKKDNENIVGASANETVQSEENVDAADIEEAVADENAISDAPVEEVKEKLVKIKMAKKHRACIGGTWYYFEEGQTYNVPAEIREILSGYPDHLLSII